MIKLLVIFTSTVISLLLQIFNNTLLNMFYFEKFA